MKKTIEEIFNILLNNDCSPIMFNPDKTGFSRTILFHTPYQDCFIEWWANISYLSIGDRYGNKIPFYDLKICNYSSSNNLCIDFMTDDKYENTIVVVLKKLDWQVTK